VHLLHDPGFVFALLLILLAVGMVLLIACANVSSLQLARSAVRQREIGVRLSVGASRARIVRQLLTESALLGVISGGVALLMTWWTLRLLMLQIANALPLEWGSVALHVEPDLGVFCYVFAVSLAASVLFGLAPALQATRPSVSAALKEEKGLIAGRLSRSGMHGLLMGTQAAACLFLLIGAGLLIRGSIRSMMQNPGYETRHALSLEIMFPPGLGYSHTKQLAEIREFSQRLRSVPGVRAVSMGNAPDGGGLRTAAVGLNGRQPATDNTARTVFYAYVTSNYFECLDIPLLLGRAFEEHANASNLSMMVSESAAAEFWPGENPIGKTVVLDVSKVFHIKGEVAPVGVTYQVVGVVKDTRAITPQGGDNRKVYLPLAPDQMNGRLPLLVRFVGESTGMTKAVSEHLHAVDRNLIAYVSTLEGLMTSTPTFVMSRSAAIFAALIGGLGLILAVVGIYGTVSYAVARRTREVGIRMALGAKRGDVLRLILSETGRPVTIGLIAGAIASAGASRWLQSLLFGLNGLDPVAFIGVGCLFLFIALLAAYVPARRAIQIDPVAALRFE
jgi:predicted permease